MKRVRIIVFSFALLLSGCSAGNSPKENHPGGGVQSGKTYWKEIPDSGEKNHAPVEPKPALVVTAEALSKEMESDAEAAAKKYCGNRIELTGEVSLVLQHDSVMLKGTPVKDISDWITCRYQPKFRKTAYYLSVNQKVKMTGVAERPYGRIQLENCTLQELEPTAIERSGSQILAKEFEEGIRSPNAIEWNFIVSGRVEKVTANAALLDGHTIELQGTGKTRVIGTISEEKTPPKLGQEIELRVQRGGYRLSENVVFLGLCILIPPRVPTEH
jgi:hypothetical protein